MILLQNIVLMEKNQERFMQKNMVADLKYQFKIESKLGKFLVHSALKPELIILIQNFSIFTSSTNSSSE